MWLHHLKDGVLPVNGVLCWGASAWDRDGGLSRLSPLSALVAIWWCCINLLTQQIRSFNTVTDVRAFYWSTEVFCEVLASHTIRSVPKKPPALPWERACLISHCL